MNTEPFCDWITVSEDHLEHHRSPCQWQATLNDHGEVVEKRRVPLDVPLKNNSSVRVFSDGHRVQFSGNPSRADRLDNFSGLSVDQAKAKINSIMAALELPAFTKYAKISRIDLTQNYATGGKAGEFLRHMQAQQCGRLGRTVTEGNVYFGIGSRHRTVRVYDKGREIRETKLKGLKGPDYEYMVNLAEWCEGQGIVRIEAQYMRSLYGIMRSWKSAQQRAIAPIFKTEVEPMAKIEVVDLESVPQPYLGTLCMYISGIDPKDHISESTYKRHKAKLKKLGYDIGANAPIPMRAQKHVIVLTPAGTPDFYRHPEEQEVG